MTQGPEGYGAGHLLHREALRLWIPPEAPQVDGHRPGVHRPPWYCGVPQASALVQTCVLQKSIWFKGSHPRNLD